jgi:hypothetical protein
MGQFVAGGEGSALIFGSNGRDARLEEDGMSEDKNGETGQAGAGEIPAPEESQTGRMQNSQGAQSTPAAQAFAEWVSTQGEDVRKMADGYAKELKVALEFERKQRQTFEQQLRDATGKLEKGSAERQNLEQLSSTLSRQAEFYNAVHAAGVTNLRLAWLAAENAGLVDEGGRVDFGKLKDGFPELFRAAAPPPGNAGSGTQQPPSRQTMNDLIRRSAGRQ